MLSVICNASLTAQAGLRSLHLLYGRERSTLTMVTEETRPCAPAPSRRSLEEWQERIARQAEEDNIRGEYFSRESLQLLNEYLREGTGTASKQPEGPSVRVDCTLTIWHTPKRSRNNQAAARQIARANSFRKTYNKAWNVTNTRGRHGSATQIRSTIDIRA